MKYDEVGADRLLGLAAVAVQFVELAEDGARVVHVATVDESAAACPACGVLSTSVKGHATTRPRELPCGRDPVHPVWHKRGWCQVRQRATRDVRGRRGRKKDSAWAGGGC